MIDDNIIPNSWQPLKLGEVCKVRNGYAFKSNDFRDSGVLLFRQTNLDGENVKLKNAVYLPEDYLEKYKDYVVKKGDVLVGMSGSIGKICVYNLDKPALQNQRTGLLQLTSVVEKKLIRYFFEVLEQEFVKKSKGIAVLNISAKDIQDSQFHLPPHHEQRRIVAKIEELFSSLDKGIESLKTTQQQLKIYRQAVLKWAFEGKLTNCELKITKLGEHADLITKGASPRWQGFHYILDENQLLFVTSENVRENFMDVSKPKYLSLEINKILKRSILKKEDVLFNLVGASIGRAAVFNLDKIANINQAVAVIILKKSMFNKYLSLFLNAEVAKQKYLEKIVDVARANLSLTDVGNIQIPLPLKLEDQHTIVAEIESRLSVCDKIEESIEQSLKQSESLRQSILKKAFEGKLVPQDHSDEPASKLLERIRAEKEALKKKK